MSETTAVDNQSKPSRPPRRRAWLRGLLLVVIFLSGGIVGSGSTLLAVRHRVLHTIHHPQEMPATVAARLRRVLGLSDKQAQQIETILRNRQREIQTIRREFRPRLEQQLDQLTDEVAEVLDDKQSDAWRKHFGRLRSTWLPAPLKPSASASEIK